MIVIAAVLVGAIWGYRKAARAGGNGFDKAQYAAVHAIALGALGVIVTILIDRAI
ncbi:hypothetical protein LZA78_05020 [Sinirhodobacter sp. WL0062]|uniref:Apolipoprotein acyltransferase n=1 Tax=Rhodobacter flavimaris TaxID=2907145 RepID=A0ABS8YSJ7_9RHOB|nr:hypothetical protein [Sinirhodobacter sp. WL0062]MCE5972832.1 hypothetical protein [Sinirhodobacter sp. WL0062]